MEKLWLRVHAPFATYSTFRSGIYRDTMSIMPPSAAYGLILNLAGIEMRGSLKHSITHGIEPTHRETIVDLDMMIGIIADPTLISRVKQGLTGKDDRPCYGLPFAGDNNYLFDRIDCLEEPAPSHWFVSVDSKLEQEPGAVSLTVEVDRHAPSKTKSMLFSATKDSLTSLPDRDWLSMYERRIIRR